MRIFRRLTVLCGIGLISTSAFASFLELRAGYGLQNIKSIENQDSNLPDHSSVSGLTADVLIIPTDLVLGIRYENLSAKKTSGNNEAQAKYNRTSFVLGYRLFNTIAYLGPLVTVGMSNLEYKIRTTSSSDLKASKLTTGIGFEAGVHLIGFLIGAEVGYLMADLGNLKDSNGSEFKGTNGSLMHADLSGTYARALIGFAF